jgi:hypothetical protein
MAKKAIKKKKVKRVVKKKAARRVAKKKKTAGSCGCCG